MFAYVCENQLDLVLCDPAAHALARPEPKRQRAEPGPLLCVPRLRSPPAGRLKASWIREHIRTTTQRVQTHLDQSLIERERGRGMGGGDRERGKERLRHC